jgi:hypothetical protein
MDMFEKMHTGKFNGINKVENVIGGIIEELSFYVTCFENGFTAYEVLPFELIKKENYDPRNVGNLVGYTHVWGGSKFTKHFIDLIKGKIYKSFNNYYSLVEEYEAKVMKEINVKPL